MRARDRLTIALGVVALAVSVLVVGGVLRWTQALVGLLVAAALAPQILARHGFARTSPLLVLLYAAAGLTALQLVPLPASVLEALNEVGFHLRMDGASLVGGDPWMSVSLDPASTLQRLVFFLILIGVATLALRFAAGERERYMLLALVAIVCGLAAGVAGAHALTRAETLYGLYEPVHLRGDRVLGPLLNANHLGCLTAVGSVLSLGLAFYRRQSTQLRVLWIAIGVGSAIVVAATLSRGAMIGLVIGLVVAAICLVASRSTRQRSLRHDLPVAIVVAACLAIALYFTAGDVASEIEDTRLSEVDRQGTKFVAWRASMSLVEESPWLGIGRGATESVFPRIHPGSARATYAHLENEYVTAVVEWGVIGAIVVGAAFTWCLVTAFRRRRDGPLAAGALGALSVVMFQSSVDYGVELLGLAVPVTVIAATVQLAPLRQAKVVARARVHRIGLVLAIGAGSMVLLLSPHARGVREDQTLLAWEYSSAHLREVFARHPLDYVGFGVAAERAWRAGDPKAVPLLNHALILHPTHPGLHQLAARMLVQAGHHSQAAAEYAFVLRVDYAPRSVLREIIATMPTSDDAANAIPIDYWNIEAMLRSLEELGRNDIAVKWLLRVVPHARHNVRHIDRLYELALRSNDLDAAKRAAEIRRATANTTTSKLMLARVLLKRSELERVLVELRDVRDWAGRLEEKAEAWLIRCDALIALKQWEQSLECLHRLDASGLATGLRLKIEQRLHAIKEERTKQANQEAIESMERALRDKQ